MGHIIAHTNLYKNSKTSASIMHVKIDVSENLRFAKKYTALAVATDDGTYKKNVCLPIRVKRRIPHYLDKREEIHAILIYHLIKDEIDKYTSIQICPDVSKKSLRNNLRKLFKGNELWKILELEKKIKLSPVKKCFVDTYVKDVRENKEERGEELNFKDMKSYLQKFN